MLEALVLFATRSSGFKERKILEPVLMSGYVLITRVLVKLGFNKISVLQK